MLVGRLVGKNARYISPHLTDPVASQVLWFHRSLVTAISYTAKVGTRRNTTERIHTTNKNQVRHAHNEKFSLLVVGRSACPYASQLARGLAGAVSKYGQISALGPKVIGR